MIIMIMIIIIICYRCMNVVLERYESTSTVAVSYVLFTIGAISSGIFQYLLLHIQIVIDIGFLIFLFHRFWL